MTPDFATPVWTRPPDWTPLPRVLPERRSFDLVVVGGGFMGLSAALEAQRLGLSTCLCEAAAIGSGASGLNGGQVIPGLKLDPDALRRIGGEALVDFAAGTADCVFDLIRREGLAVPLARRGWIQAAHTQAAMRRLSDRDRQWRATGADVAMLDASEVAGLTGARGYVGGWLDRRAGRIDPLSLVLEMARRVRELGGEIAESCRILSLRQDGGGWTVATAQGDLRARRVIVATNAASDGLVPGLARTVVALNSFQIATVPLPDDIGSTILPGDRPVSDSRRILVYYRKDAAGRLVLGGRGAARSRFTAADWGHLERAMVRLFPQLAGVGIERRWFGRVALTPDHLPHVHEPEPGLVTAIGCQGRGVGVMTALGARLARYQADGAPASLPFPVRPIRPIPLHGFRRAGIALAIAWFRLLDGMET